MFQIEIDKLKADVKIKLDKIEKLGNLTYDEDCEHCMSNPLTIDARETEKNLEKDKELAVSNATNQIEKDLNQLKNDLKNQKVERELFEKTLNEKR